MAKENIRHLIIQATKEEINENGSNFTLDTLAKRVGISKKTIYNNFADKSELILCVIVDIFEKLAEERARLINDTEMDIVEKIKKLLGLIPLELLDIDLRKYEEIFRKYPKTIEYADERMDIEWGYVEENISLAMKQGRIKRTNISAVKIVASGTVRYYLHNKDLCKHKDVTISEIVSIIMNGLRMQ